jgi:hypothetical protein
MDLRMPPHTQNYYQRVHAYKIPLFITQSYHSLENKYRGILIMQQCFGCPIF